MSAELNKALDCIQKSFNLTWFRDKNPCDEQKNAETRSCTDEYNNLTMIDVKGLDCEF